MLSPFGKFFIFCMAVMVFSAGMTSAAASVFLPFGFGMALMGCVTGMYEEKK